MSQEPYDRDAEAVESSASATWELNSTMQEILAVLERIATCMEAVGTARGAPPTTCNRCGDRWDVGADHVCNAGKK